MGKDRSWREITSFFDGTVEQLLQGISGVTPRQDAVHGRCQMAEAIALGAWLASRVSQLRSAWSG
jgi:hypothetical protein